MGVLAVKVSTPFTVSVAAAATDVTFGIVFAVPAVAFVASVVNVFVVVVKLAAVPAVTVADDPVVAESAVRTRTFELVAQTADIGVWVFTTVSGVTAVGVFAVNTLTPLTVSVVAAATEMFGTVMAVPRVTFEASVTNVFVSVLRDAAVPAVTVAEELVVAAPIEWVCDLRLKAFLMSVMKWLKPLLSRYLAIVPPYVITAFQRSVISMLVSA